MPTKETMNHAFKVTVTATRYVVLTDAEIEAAGSVYRALHKELYARYRAGCYGCDDFKVVSEQHGIGITADGLV